MRDRPEPLTRRSLGGQAALAAYRASRAQSRLSLRAGLAAERAALRAGRTLPPAPPEVPSAEVPASMAEETSIFASLMGRSPPADTACGGEQPWLAGASAPDATPPAPAQEMAAEPPPETPEQAPALASLVPVAGDHTPPTPDAPPGPAPEDPPVLASAAPEPVEDPPAAPPPLEDLAAPPLLDDLAAPPLLDDLAAPPPTEKSPTPCLLDVAEAEATLDAPAPVPLPPGLTAATDLSAIPELGPGMPSAGATRLSYLR